MAFLREAIYLMAALTFASGSKTLLPALPSSVDRQVDDRYWNTPDALEDSFLALGLNPDSSLAIQRGADD
jgi:hypothetical protein